MDDSTPMPFGKYKGRKMEDVPADYLLWLRDQKCRDQQVSEYIENNLSALLKECPDYIAK